MASYPMTNFGSPYTITEQPRQIKNSFGLISGERILQTYECDAKCCGVGDIHTVTLTDARVIQRRKTHRCCCACGKFDSMLFLSDISNVRTSFDTRCGACQFTCAGLLYCLICDIGCCCWVCKSCGNQGIPITFHGGFGSEVFTFDKGSVAQALIDIPGAAIPHKTSRYTGAAQPMTPDPPITKSHRRPHNQRNEKYDEF